MNTDASFFRDNSLGAEPAESSRGEKIPGVGCADEYEHEEPRREKEERGLVFPAVFEWEDSFSILSFPPAVEADGSSGKSGFHWRGDVGL